MPADSTKQQYAHELNAARRRLKTIKQSVQENSVKKISFLEFAIILFIALANDLLDYLGTAIDVSSLGITAPVIQIALPIVDLLTSAILGLWCLIRLKKFPKARFSITFLIELIPYLGTLSPTWTVFILSEWVKQSGLIKRVKNIKK